MSQASLPPTPNKMPDKGKILQIWGAAIVFVVLSFLLLRWLYLLPNWSEVGKNFLFFLIGRFRSTQYAEELWRLWGFAFLGAGSGLTWLMWRQNTKLASLPLGLGVIIGGILLFPLISPELKIGGLALSLILAILGIVAAFPIGLLFGIGRTSKLPVIRWLSTIYIELLRGLPFITIIFWFFIFVPYVLGEGTQFWAVVLALALFTGAYVAEIMRAGIQALPNGQSEAARALGLTGSQTMLTVVLPQALKNMIPPLVGQFISLFKDTSLVSIVGFIELAGAARITGNRVIVANFEIYVAISLLYFVFAWLLSRVAADLEQRS